MASYVSPYRGQSQLIPPGLLQAQMQAGENIARGVEQLGAGIGKGMGNALNYYMKRKEQHDMADADIAGAIMSLPEAQGPSSDPKRYGSAAEENVAKVLESHGISAGVYQKVKDGDAPLKDKLIVASALKHYVGRQQQDLAAQAARAQINLTNAQIGKYNLEQQSADALTAAIPAIYGVKPQTIPESYTVEEQVPIQGPVPPPPTASTAVQGPLQINPDWTRWQERRPMLEQDLPDWTNRLAQYQSKTSATPSQYFVPTVSTGGTLALGQYVKESELSAAKRAQSYRNKAAEASAKIKSMREELAQPEPTKEIPMQSSVTQQTQAPSDLGTATVRRTDTTTKTVQPTYTDFMLAADKAIKDKGLKPTPEVWKQIEEAARNVRGVELQPLSDGSIMVSDGGRFKDIIKAASPSISDMLQMKGVEITPNTGYQGIAPSLQEAKDFRTAAALTLNATHGIDELLEIAKTPGKSFSPAQRKRAETIQSTLVGALRVSIVGPGAMTPDERTLIQSMIANPTKFFSLDNSNTTALNTAKEFVNRNLDAMAQVMNLQKVDGRQQQTSSSTSGVKVLSITKK